jgi:hypothetical protein
MVATGLDVFDKTPQTTNIRLDEIMEAIGPDRQVAWHVLRCRASRLARPALSRSGSASWLTVSAFSPWSLLRPGSRRSSPIKPAHSKGSSSTAGGHSAGLARKLS